jgi:hypothetical protein
MDKEALLRKTLLRGPRWEYWERHETTADLSVLVVKDSNFNYCTKEI